MILLKCICIYLSPLIRACLVGLGFRMLRLQDPINECPGYDTKQSDGEVQVMLELLGMRSTPSFPSLQGPLWLEVVAPDRIQSHGSNRTKMRTYA